MDMPSIVAGCLNGLGIAVAAVDLADWRVVFANPRFERLFPAADEHLPGRLPGFQPDQALDRLREGRTWRTEIETGQPTPVCVAVEIRMLPEAPALALVEARDIGKQKRAEYMLDSYSRLAERHARQLARETERAEKLLLNVMPRSVYEEMKNYGAVTPQRFDEASVVMLDFVGFTEMAVAANPSALVAELNDIFAAFDRIVELFGCERIKTVGDCYIAVAGLPEPSPDHVANAARAALRMRRYLERRNGARGIEWRARIGIGTGALIGSLIGIQKYVYDVFGPAANLAARLEAHARPMQIVLPERAWREIEDGFTTSPLGTADLKGFGPTALYALDGEN